MASSSLQPAWVLSSQPGILTSPPPTNRQLFASDHPDDDDDDDDDDDEDEQEVEDLLWAAQMDLIGHRTSNAISKLNQAVNLKSSAACASLANLLARGIREDQSKLPPNSPPMYGSQHRRGTWPAEQHPRTDSRSPDRDSEHHHDSLEAARLFITGLQYELEKPIAPSSSAGRDSHSSKVPLRRTGSSSSSSHVRNRSLDGSPSESESEEEGAEGRYFSLERVLDLVVGLTDCYRYGILHPLDTSSVSSSSSSTESVATLWTRGALVAAETLRHPLIREFIPSAPPSSPSPNTISPIQNRQLMGNTNRTGSPRRQSVERSYAHPSSSLASTFLPSSYLASSHHLHLSTHLKHRLTIQIHLLYLLALQKYPTDRALSEKYWSEIVRIASNTGGVVGTKEGNELVAKATRRLQLAHTTEADDSWKALKHRPRPAHAPVKHASGDDWLARKAKGAMSGDALVEMWYEKHGSLNEKASRVLAGEELLEEPSDGQFGSFASNASTIRPPREASDATIRPSPAQLLSTSPRLHSNLRLPAVVDDQQPQREVKEEEEGESAATATDLKASLTAAVSQSLSRRPSKFHFATTSDYPSPPETPVPSPPTNHEDLSAGPVEQTSSADEVASSSSSLAPESPTTKSKLKSAVPGRLLRRKASSSSFQPPTLPRLLRRAESSASVSTLPPDFFSSKDRNPIGGKDWRAATGPATISASPFDGLDSRSGVPSYATPPPGGWSAGFWNRVSHLRSRSTRVASSLNPFKNEPEVLPSATKSLEKILLKDDLSAGEGMYWADPSELEEGEHGGEEQAPVTFAPVASTSKLPPPPPPPPVLESGASSDSSPFASGPPSRTSSPTHLRTVSTSAIPAAVQQLRAPRPHAAQKRSFVDVTSRSPPRHHHHDGGKPEAAFTPPTPDKSSSDKGKGKAAVKHADGSVDIDPLLLELERKSRVGVKTVCATCGKKGLNFPAVRTGETYCSRICRLEGRDARTLAETPISIAE
ncbi:hypothetical protein T439DRAFT_320174 [Meredithblackwellia eburnea MCA 4105]